jgi:hypothetical protein
LLLLELKILFLERSIGKLNTRSALFIDVVVVLSVVDGVGMVMALERSIVK